MCLFRKRTFHRVLALAKDPQPDLLLLKLIDSEEPLFSALPKVHADSVFSKHFKQRIGEVWDWMRECEHRVKNL